MKYSTRKQARTVATLLNTQSAGLVLAPTEKSANGWKITFKRGLLTLKKDNKV
jgi:hypothetical protein